MDIYKYCISIDKYRIGIYKHRNGNKSRADIYEFRWSLSWAEKMLTVWYTHNDIHDQFFKLRFQGK